MNELNGGNPVFAQIVQLEERRRRLESESATPAVFNPITKVELEELRRMTRPPDNVKRCLEIIYAVLHIEGMKAELQKLGTGSEELKPASVKIKWSAVQTMLARFDSFFPAMANYDIGPLVATPELTNYLWRTYFDADRGGLTEPAVRRSSQACAGLFRWCGSSLGRVRAAIELAAVNAELLALTLVEPPSEDAFVPFWDASASHTDLQISADRSRVSAETAGYSSGVRAALGEFPLDHDMNRVTFLYESGSSAYLVIGVCAIGDPDFSDAEGRPLNSWERASESRHKACWQYSFYYDAFSIDGAEWAESGGSPSLGAQGVRPGDQIDMELALPAGTLSFFCRSSGRRDRRLLGAMHGLRGTFRAIALLGLQGQSLRVMRFEQSSSAR